MAVLLSPLFNNDGSQIDANGVPRSGAKLFTYVSGSSTKVTVFRDAAGSVAHTNPIILDANGLPPAPIFLTTGASVKFVLAPASDTDPPASAILTIDNISPINDVAGVAGTEWIASGLTPTYISATSFSVAGDQTSIVHVGRRLKLTVTAGTVYATIIRSVYTSLTTLTILVDSGSLDSGLSAFFYGIASADNTSLPFVSRDQQCGRLGYVSATSISLTPQDGNTIWVFTGSAWKLWIIPSAGVTAANTNIYIDGTGGQSLAADTTYYVYLWDNAGVLTMDFSTTAPAVDAASGLKIKTGVATRLLIGMVRTNTSTPGQFQTPALVLSWYRRRGISASGGITTPRTSASASIVELHSEIRAKFLTWNEEAVQAHFSGYAGQATAGASHTTAICVDAALTVIDQTAVNGPLNNYVDNVSLAAQLPMAEGFHYMTLGVTVSSSTATWTTGNMRVMTQG